MSGKHRSRRVTIADVARAAGVSPTTVSFVMQGKGRISDRTAAAVRRAMGDLGYVYDRSAANLRTRSSRLVGLVVNDLSNPYFAELAAGVETVLGESGYLPVIGDSREDEGHQKELVVSMGEHGVAGFILSTAYDVRAEDLEMTRAFGAPCVLCVRDPRLPGFDFVGSDDRRGAELAMEHLIRAGHTAIAFVGGLEGATPRADRFAAYRAALERLPAPVEDDLTVTCPPTREAGREAASRLLGSATVFTAALCYNDVVAFGFCVGLRESGIAAGRDVAVVGFDNLPESEAWTPPLTTIEMLPRTVGMEAARLLLRRLEEPQALPRSILLPPRLVVRASSQSAS